MINDTYSVCNACGDECANRLMYECRGLLLCQECAPEVASFDELEQIEQAHLDEGECT